MSKEKNLRSVFSGKPWRNAVLLSIGAKVFVVLLNAGTGILTARLLSPSGRGELAALLLWPLLLSGLVTLGLPSALTFCLRAQPERSEGLKSAAIVICLFSGVLTSIAAVFFAPLLLRQYNPDLIHAAQILMPNTVIALLLLVGRGALEADGKFGHSNLILVTPPALTLLGLSALAMSGGLNAERAAFTYIVAGFPSFIVLCKRLSLKFVAPVKSVLSAARELLSYGLRSYGMDLCGTLSIYLDQALVVTLLSPSQMGTYVIALSVSRILNVLPQALASVLFPKLVGLSSSTISEMIGKVLRLVTVSSAVSLLFITVLGPFMVHLLYGDQYSGLVTVLRLLSLEAALSGLVTLASQGFLASNRPGIVTLQQILGLVLAIPLLLILIPRFGVVGAGCGILISTVVRLLLTVSSFPLVLEVKPPSFFLKPRDVAWMFDQFGLAVVRNGSSPLRFGFRNSL